MPDFKLKPQAPNFATAEEVAKFFGKSERWVRDAAKRGLFPKEDHGLYDLKKIARVLKGKKAKELMKQIEARTESQPTAASGASPDPEVGYEMERTRRVRVQRERDELRLATERGLLISVETYRSKLTKICGIIRERILGIPAIAPELEGLSAEERRAKLDKICRAALSELSDGELIPATRDAGEFERGANGDGLGPASPAPADPPDGERVGGPEPLPAQGQ